jgi:hypothetical protein
MSGVLKQSNESVNSKDLVAKLKAAFSRSGDFPACAKVVMQIRECASSGAASAQQMTSLVLQEPSLGMRIIGLVNSSMMQRGKPIVSVSQAIVHIGMNQLAELCASLVLLQRLVPAARQNGPFAQALRHMFITALLCANLGKGTLGRDSKKEDFGYLMGSFAEIGPLLLAYYYPPVYEAVIKRSAQKQVVLGRAFFEITGMRPTMLSLEVTEQLSLPSLYKNALVGSESVGDPGKRAALIGGAISPELSEAHRYSKNIYTARTLAEHITFGTPQETLQQIVARCSAECGLDLEIITQALGALPSEFRSMCEVVEVALPPLPEWLTAINSKDTKTTPVANESTPEWLESIRESVEAREPTVTIITEVMESLAWELNFDRVLLLLANPAKTALLGRMAVGNKVIGDPKQIVRPLGRGADTEAPENKAFTSQIPILTGKPIYDGAKECIAIPIGTGSRTIGVIYADKLTSTPDRQEKLLKVVSEVLDRAVEVNS